MESELRGAFRHVRLQGGPFLVFGSDFAQNVDEHGLDDEAVVVVEVEAWSVAVPSVAEIPVLMFVDGVVDAHGIPVGGFRMMEKAFDNGGEQEPVVAVGLPCAGGAHGVEQTRLDVVIQRFPKFMRRAEDAFGQKGGIDDRVETM